jgi:hypothetical protein
MSNAMQINPAVASGQYADKMNEIATKAFTEWWNSLSKEELLQYLADQPALTADELRKMLGAVNTTLAFDISFALKSQEAHTNFHTE